MRRKITDLREERASLFEQMKAISEQAEGEGRDLNAEESQEYTRVAEAFDSLTSRVERLERESGLEPHMSREVALPEREDREIETPAERRVIAPTATPEYRAAFNEYLRHGKAGISAETRAAMQVGTDSEGGYTVPDEWANQLVEARREFGVMRQLATVIQTTESGDLHVPKVDTAGTAALTAEEAAFTESEDTFAEVVFGSFKIGTLIKISDELLHDSLFDLSGFIQRRAAQAIAIKENNYFVVGTGSGQPNGITVAATSGVTAASATAITADELIDLYHTVLSPYRRNASWMVKDSTAKLIRKLKDTQNQYLWQPGLQAGQPDVLLGRPVFTDPDMPAAASAAESVVFGDVSGYWIRDVEKPVVKVLNELYAANGQVGFRVHVRTDGDLVDTVGVRTLSQAV